MARSHNKKKRRRLSPMLKLAMVLCAALMIFSGFSELKTMYDLHSSISDTQQKQSALKAEKKELTKKKKDLSDPDYIEYIARGKYLVTKEGEQVFKFSNDDTNN